VDPLNEGEELDYDSTAYEMMYRLNVDWPCLSFDVVRDKLGYQRTKVTTIFALLKAFNLLISIKFPHTLHIVAGTQADTAENNRIYLMKASQLYRTKHDADEDSDGNENDTSILIVRRVKLISSPLWFTI